MFYTLRRGGIALIASAGLLLLLIIWSFSLPATGRPPVIYVLLNIATYVLLLAGLPAIYAVQPDAPATPAAVEGTPPRPGMFSNLIPQTSRVKQIGFICMALGAAISVIALFLALFGLTNLPGVIDWLFLITNVVGYIIVGWLTARGGAFPSWAGWLLFAAGAISALIGPGYGDLLLIPALGGFGITIVRLTQPLASSLTDDEPTVEPQA